MAAMAFISFALQKAKRRHDEQGQLSLAFVLSLFDEI